MVISPTLGERGLAVSGCARALSLVAMALLVLASPPASAETASWSSNSRSKANAYLDGRCLSEWEVELSGRVGSSWQYTGPLIRVLSGGRDKRDDPKDGGWGASVVLGVDNGSYEIRLYANAFPRDEKMVLVRGPFAGPLGERMTSGLLRGATAPPEGLPVSIRAVRMGAGIHLLANAGPHQISTLIGNELLPKACDYLKVYSWADTTHVEVRVTQWGGDSEPAPDHVVALSKGYDRDAGEFLPRDLAGLVELGEWEMVATAIEMGRVPAKAWLAALVEEGEGAEAEALRRWLVSVLDIVSSTQTGITSHRVGQLQSELVRIRGLDDQMLVGLRQKLAGAYEKEDWESFERLQRIVADREATLLPPQSAPVQTAQGDTVVVVVGDGQRRTLRRPPSLEDLATTLDRLDGKGSIGVGGRAGLHLIDMILGL